MESKLYIDNTTKKLLISGETSLLHSESNVELTWKHIVDTTSGSVDVYGSIFKHVSFGDLPVNSKPGVDQRLRVSAGIEGSSTSPDTLLVLRARKTHNLAERVKVVRGKDSVDSRTDVRAKGKYVYNLMSDAWTGTGYLGVSQCLFNLHSTMDLRLSAGVQADYSKGKSSKVDLQPVIKLEENAWSLEMRPKNNKMNWNLTYSL
jgi:hypothetical protein